MKREEIQRASGSYETYIEIIDEKTQVSAETFNRLQDLIKKDIQNTISSLKTHVKQELTKERLGEHPVGSLYISENNTDPNKIFGGQWERIEDCFLYCAGSKHTAGETGGSETNTHQHYQTCSFDGANGYISSTSTRTRVIQNKHGANIVPDNVGNFGKREDSTYEETINIMPPFLGVYVWKRIS